MGFWNKFMGNDEDDTPRTLEHPRDLNLHDIIKFKFLPQQTLSGKRFEVVDVNTYDFEDEHLTEFTLKSDNGYTVFMIVDETDDEPCLSLSHKLSRREVEKTFDMDQFADIFDGNGRTSVEVLKEPEFDTGWVAPVYFQEIQGEVGYYHKGDYRGRGVPQGEDDGDDFEYYYLESDDEEFSIEIEVYEGGDTEVALTVYRDIEDIEEMWPQK